MSEKDSLIRCILALLDGAGQYHNTLKDMFKAAASKDAKAFARITLSVQKGKPTAQEFAAEMLQYVSGRHWCELTLEKGVPTFCVEQPGSTMLSSAVHLLRFGQAIKGVIKEMKLPETLEVKVQSGPVKADMVKQWARDGEQLFKPDILKDAKEIDLLFDQKQRDELRAELIKADKLAVVRVIAETCTRGDDGEVEGVHLGLEVYAPKPTSGAAESDA